MIAVHAPLALDRRIREKITDVLIAELGEELQVFGWRLGQPGPTSDLVGLTDGTTNLR
jgi:hypothetical protein